MKTTIKINSILLSTIIMFMTVFISCSKDDSNPEPTDDRDQLVLAISKTNVMVNETVTFAVTANGKAVTGAEVYIDDNLANSLIWHFSAGGTYTVTAKKDGYKDSEPQTITVKEPVKITATQVITTPRSPALGRSSRMCYGNGKIYTFDDANKKFMSYDIGNKTWKTLVYDGQLNSGGQMIYNTSSGVICYFNGNNNQYYFTGDSWKPTTPVDIAFRAYEAGYMISGRTGLIYCAGGRMLGKNSSTDLREYDTYHNTWKKVADMPVALNSANAINDGSGTMYIIGEREDNTRTGVIFDTDELTVKNWSVPQEIYSVSSRYQMAFHSGYLFYNDGGSDFYAYNMQTEKWLDAEVTISGDFLSGSANLFVVGSNFYAAGEKDGNFALYKLTVSLQ